MRPAASALIFALTLAAAAAVWAAVYGSLAAGQPRAGVERAVLALAAGCYAAASSVVLAGAAYLLSWPLGLLTRKD